MDLISRSENIDRKRPLATQNYRFLVLKLKYVKPLPTAEVAVELEGLFHMTDDQHDNADDLLEEIGSTVAGNDPALVGGTKFEDLQCNFMHVSGQFRSFALESNKARDSTPRKNITGGYTPMFARHDFMASMTACGPVAVPPIDANTAAGIGLNLSGIPVSTFFSSREEFPAILDAVPHVWF